MKMKTRGLAAFLVIIAIGAALIGTGCPGDGPAGEKEYAVTIAAGIQNGTITANPTKATAGTPIELTITPHVGYRLKGNVVVKDAYATQYPINVTGSNTRAFTMPAVNVTVSGEFEKIDGGGPPSTTYAITVAAGIANGTITADLAEAEEGDTVTLTITPNNGYRLKTVGAKDADETDVILSGAGNTRTFTMPASDVTVNGEFEQQPYTITITPSPNGAVAVTTPANKTEYLAGETITLTITPNTGYALDSITAAADTGTAVTLSGTDPTRTFTMPIGNVTVTAAFKGILYTIALTQPPAGNGTIEASATTATIGTQVNLTLVPPAGNYGLNSLTVTAGTQSITVNGGGLYRFFTMPAANVTVTVGYKEITTGTSHTITLPPTVPEGSISADPAGPTYPGVFVKLTIAPTEGYRLKSISVKNASNQDVTPLGVAENARSFTMPDSDVTVTAEWEIITDTTINVTFSGSDNEVIDLYYYENTVLSKSGYNSLHVYIHTAYDNYEWYVDDQLYGSGSGVSSIDVHASNLTVGRHRVTAIVWKSGVPYSKELIFDVVW